MSKPLVVIVEDNPDVLELVKTALESKYEVKAYDRYETCQIEPNALAYLLDYNNEHGMNGEQ